VIRLAHVGFSYGSEPVLTDVSFELGPGLTLLVGPNGSGKSTLLKIVAGVERPDSGAVELDGFDLWIREVEARRGLAYVSEHADVTPYATIRDVIDLVCRLRSQPLHVGTAALARAGLNGLNSRSIRQLSMGQRRRVILAAAWVGSPRVVVLDEPLEAMDRAIRSEILDWIDELLEGGATILIATHQLEPFAARAHRAIAIRNGVVQVIDPLAGDAAERITLLDALSRP
jgi:ABC-type multidrug transport system ATPase subunit